MKKIITFLSATIISIQLFSQPAIQWQNTIGGSDLDNLYEIHQTSDGGYILGGHSQSNISGDKSENSNGGLDFWIVKTDASGSIQWQNSIGGNNNDLLLSMQHTSDGGYILGGTSLSNISGDKTENSNGSLDFWIVKTDSSGSIEWQNTIGGNGIDDLNSIQQTTDGGYILGGSSYSNISGDKTENNNGERDYWIVKIDVTGNIQWQNTIGGNYEDYLYAIQQTTDGGFIMGGISRSGISGDKTENSNGDHDYWIVKTDSSGNIQWQNTIGGSGIDLFRTIRQTNDGGYIMGGYSESNISGDKLENSVGSIGYPDYWVIKIDSSGTIQWQNTIGGNNYDYLYSIIQTSDGGYNLGGFSNSNISGDKTENSVGSIGYSDYWAIKIDAFGNIQWQHTIGGTTFDVLFSIKQTSDGGYILGGLSTSDISGDKTENCIGNNDYWIVKLAPDTITGIPHFNAPQTKLVAALFPNPVFNTSTISFYIFQTENVSLKLYDVNGRLVTTIADKIFEAGENKLEWNASEVNTGIYFLRTEIANYSDNQKLVVVK